jgi:CO/xanthine dehydrogenase FAD-binding subunit
VSSIHYERPRTIDEAIGLLDAARGSGQVLAGGTDLLVRLRTGQLAAEQIVDVKRIPELRSIERVEDGWRIGAAVSGAEIGEHAELSVAWPGVVEAAELIGSTQIQGRATLGGNLCNASPAADSVPALIAAAATCTIAGPAGRRIVQVEDVVTGPGETCLEQGELVVDFLLPNRLPGSGNAYLRLIPRSEMDIAIVGAGVSLTLDESGRCSACRLALGAVAPTPLLVEAAAAALIGSEVDSAALARLQQVASAAARPIDDKRGTAAYRTRVAGVLARRAAESALERARSGA